MEERFITTFIQCYFIAFGVLAGGSLIGSLGNFIVGEPPLTSIIHIGRRLRIWAIIAAIGGTFDAIYSFEKGFFEGSTIDLIKQLLLILSAMAGAKTALLCLEWFVQEEIT
ncbi:YtrH family sporulation protein [Salirhabdus salicampi]|uniref:YtrH family sporulation protein n=1 Tax=Salirhabdus salicampi TaxID=476102 RepID=UPI0020C2E303|nr:YtrH family sporulation protein [Salirhabdus salicampi]